LRFHSNPLVMAAWDMLAEPIYAVEKPVDLLRWYALAWRRIRSVS